MRIGFIGVGNMGGPIASHILAAGHELQAFDINNESLERVAELGAVAATSAAKASEGAEAVFCPYRCPAMSPKWYRETVVFLA